MALRRGRRRRAAALRWLGIAVGGGGGAAGRHRGVAPRRGYAGAMRSLLAALVSLMASLCPAKGPTRGAPRRRAGIRFRRPRRRLPSAWRKSWACGSRCCAVAGVAAARGPGRRRPAGDVPAVPRATDVQFARLRWFDDGSRASRCARPATRSRATRAGSPARRPLQGARAQRSGHGRLREPAGRRPPDHARAPPRGRDGARRHLQRAAARRHGDAAAVRPDRRPAQRADRVGQPLQAGVPHLLHVPRQPGELRARGLPAAAGNAVLDARRDVPSEGAR